jgi:hypothetical protein
MTKLIIKFWVINLIVSIALFLMYRVAICETKSQESGFLETIIQILDIVLNIFYSFTYFIVIVVSSLALFLNLIDKIRNHFYLSLITFIGVPLISFLFFLFIFLSENDWNFSKSAKGKFLHNFIEDLIICSLIYLIFISINFLIFRKKIKKYEMNG